MRQPRDVSDPTPDRGVPDHVVEYQKRLNAAWDAKEKAIDLLTPEWRADPFGVFEHELRARVDEDGMVTTADLEELQLLLDAAQCVQSRERTQTVADLHSLPKAQQARFRRMRVDPHSRALLRLRANHARLPVRPCPMRGGPQRRHVRRRRVASSPRRARAPGRLADDPEPEPVATLAGAIR